MSTKLNVPSTYFWEAGKYKELEYVTKTSSGAYNETSTTSLVVYSGNDGTQGLFTKLATALASYIVSATDFNNKVEYTDSVLTSFKNKIINGNFDIWQRGTSQTAPNYGSDDRWVNSNTGSTKLSTRQLFIVGQTEVPNNPTYYSRTVVTSVAGAGNYCFKSQRIEGVSTFSGKTITVSFYAKADAAKNIAIEINQSFGTGGSPSAIVTAIGVTTFALSSSWVKYTTTISVPSITGKTVGLNGDDYLNFIIWFEAGSNFNSRTNSLGNQSGTFDIAQVQIESGSIATVFDQRPIGTELALCQRYYEKIDVSENYAITVGQAVSATQCTMCFYNSVEMRVNPIVSILNLGATGASGSATNSLSAIVLNRPTTKYTQLVCNTSGLSAGNATSICGITPGNGYVKFDAEL